MQVVACSTPTGCVHGAYHQTLIIWIPVQNLRLRPIKNLHLHELDIDRGSSCLVEDDENLEADPNPDPDLQIVEETPEEAGKCWD